MSSQVPIINIGPVSQQFSGLTIRPLIQIPPPVISQPSISLSSPAMGIQRPTVFSTTAPIIVPIASPPKLTVASPRPKSPITGPNPFIIAPISSPPTLTVRPPKLPLIAPISPPPKLTVTSPVPGSKPLITAPISPPPKLIVTPPSSQLIVGSPLGSVSPAKSVLINLANIQPSTTSIEIPGLKGFSKTKVNDKINFGTGFTMETVNNMREQIGKFWAQSRFAGKYNPTSISAEDLKLLFLLYDKYFFAGYINGLLRAKNGTLIIEFNPRFTRTIGRCSYRGCNYTMNFSWEAINRIANDPNPENRQIGGISCQTMVKCLQLVMEHELIHLILQLNNIQERHGSQFRRIIFAFFGHSQISHHQLPEFDEDALSRETAEVGMRVSDNFKGEIKYGIIIKLNPKRAKVRISDGRVFNVSYHLLKQLFPGDDGYDIASLGPARKPLIQDISKGQFQVGSRVKFTYKNSVQQGTVTKLNPKTAGVKTDDNLDLRVPYQLLTSILPGQPGYLPSKQISSVARKGLTREQARIGMRVKLKYKGQVRQGTIVKLNPKTAGVDTDDGLQMRTSYALLTAI